MVSHLATTVTLIYGLGLTLNAAFAVQLVLSVIRRDHAFDSLSTNTLILSIATAGAALLVGDMIAGNSTSASAAGFDAAVFGIAGISTAWFTRRWHNTITGWLPVVVTAGGGFLAGVFR